MDLKQMRYFVALYEERNMTRAARRVHVVQAAVSQQIRRLEASFGLELFERAVTGVVPNAIAHRLYPLCLQALEAADEVRTALSESSGQIAGKVSFGILSALPPLIVPQILMEFHEQYPDVELAVRDGYSQHLLEGVVLGDLDFAVVARAEPRPTVRQVVLAEEELMAVVSNETYPTGDTMSGRELAQLRVVLPSAGNFQRNFMVSELEKRGIVIRPEIEVDSAIGVFHIVTHPGWASIISPSTFPVGQFGSRVRCVRLVEPTLKRTLVLAYPQHKELSPAASLLVQSFTEALRQSQLFDVVRDRAG
jgi:DNA-binding transcriptional LysR family regulator